MRLIGLTLAVFFLSLSAFADEPAVKLCASREISDEFLAIVAMNEEDFSISAAKSALDTFSGYLPETLETPCVADGGCDNHFLISYANSKRIFTGTLLRQEALLACKRSDVIKSQPEPHLPALQKAQEACQERTREFCSFLAEAYFAD
jgi:hypothetical protein